MTAYSPQQAAPDKGAASPRSDMAQTIAAVLSDGYTVTENELGWIEARITDALPDTDFVRVAQDDTHWEVFHLTHNELLKGGSSFSGSLLGFVPTVVLELCETIR